MPLKGTGNVSIYHNLSVKKLSLKQRKFINEYANTFGNATEAAMRAYGCRSRNVAGVTGYRLLRKANVSGAIEDVLSKAMLSEEAIAQRLKDLVNLNSLEGIKLALKLHGYKDI